MRYVSRRRMAAMNRTAWNEIAADWEKRGKDVAIDPAFFRRGGSTLYPFEPGLLGPVRGKRLLHLLCGAGEDSISWARLGARVTGIDISEKRLEFARRRARDAGAEVNFIRADTMRLPFRPGSFDRVFAARGILCWIPDVQRWMRGIARVMRPGGRFLLVDDHPLTAIFDMKGNRRLFVSGNYFQRRPEAAGGWWFKVGIKRPKFKAEVTWRISDVVNAVVRSGLRMERMEELPLTAGKVDVFRVYSVRWHGRIPHDLVLLCRKPS